MHDFNMKMLGKRTILPLNIVWCQLLGWLGIIRKGFNPNTLINSGRETICM